MRGHAPIAAPQPAPGTPVLQRKCTSCGSGMQSAANGKSSTCSACAESEQDPAEALVQRAIHGAPRPLDESARAQMEAGFGHDFSGVRVHADHAAGAAAQSVGAVAFTLGERVVFAPGQYQPASAGGRRLIAHELAHVLQQRAGGSAVQARAAGALRIGSADDPLEHEADRLADAALAPGPSSPARATPTRAGGIIQRQTPPAPAAQPEPVEPTQTQMDVIRAAARAGAVRTQIAMFRARGIVPPGQEGAVSRARSLAQRMFNWPDPNMEQIGEILGNMSGRLTNPNVKVAAAGDTRCATWEAFVVGNRPPIILCSRFFARTNTDEQRVRTMIHEAAHAVGIGQPGGESYCMYFDCQSTCGGFEAADSWAHYVHCLSDQTPDQPPPAVAPAPSGPPRP